MQNTSVSKKVIIVFSLLIVMALLVSTTGIIGMYLVQQADQAMYDNNVIAMDLSTSLEINYANQHMHLRNLIISPYGTTPYNDTLKYLAETEEKMLLLLSAYEKIIITNEARELFDLIQYEYDGEFTTVKKQVIEQSKKAALDEAYFADLMRMNESVKRIAANLEKCFVLNFDMTTAAMERNQSRFRTMVIVQIIVIVLIVIVGIILARYLNTTIAKPLVEMAKAADKIAQGDMDVTLPPASGDEVGQLAHAFNTMVESIRQQADTISCIAQGDLTVKLDKRSDNDVVADAIADMTDSLNHVITDVSAMASKVAKSANVSTKGSQAMARGVSQQATAIEELSSSIYEISLNTRENAKMTDKAAELYKDVNARAIESIQLMSDMLHSVEEITDASANVAKIIRMINDIAFQTNILSLNAAVEAANAGQHGRGFAVVAGEVRNLAMKSAKAATDTDALIENTLQKARQGATMAEKTHAALDAITRDIITGTRMIEDIAKATGEQALGIEQVNIGIEQVAQVVNINSATAEEGSMAAEEMASMAEAMESIVANFKTTAISADKAEKVTVEKDSSKNDTKPVIVLDEIIIDDKY